MCLFSSPPRSPSLSILSGRTDNKHIYPLVSLRDSSRSYIRTTVMYSSSYKKGPVVAHPAVCEASSPGHMQYLMQYK